MRSEARASDAKGAGRPAVVLTVAYSGTGFSGFARQEDAVTVQGRLEEALATVLRRPTDTVCAGRTDAGVHARGQVVSFDATGGEPEPADLARSLTAIAGAGIAVTEIRYAVPGFSARFDAVSREYRYRIAPGPTPPVFTGQVAWWVRSSLDIEAMRDAASLLVGEHDFRSFCVTESAQGKRTVRRVDAIRVLETEELGEAVVEIRVVGNAFLHSMVRVIVGSLVEVGQGRRQAAWLADVLAARDRSAAGPTAPAHGLTLWEVVYAPGCFIEPPTGT